MKGNEGGGSVRYAPTIKELPEDQRPRERLIREGPESLSDAELLAILLRTGIKGTSAVHLATWLLAEYKGLTGLIKASAGELKRKKGVGLSKACQIKAALEVGRRAYKVSRLEKRKIRTAQDVADLIMSEMRFLDREHLRVLLLDTKNQVMKVTNVSVGTLNASLAHPRECFKEAVREGAAAVIFVHNHPSGDPKPSPEDIALTKQLVDAGRVLNIDVLDHIIIGDGLFTSLRECGLM